MSKKLIWKKIISPANEFIQHTLEAVGKLKKKIEYLKNVQVHLISFYYMGEKYSRT